MRLRLALQSGWQAARSNFVPGLILQAAMLVFLAAYLSHDGFRDFLDRVAVVRREMDYGFAFFSNIFAGAVLPEILRIVVFQKGRFARTNLVSIFTAAPVWGVMGVVVDFFYRCQLAWFGDSVAPLVIVTKVAVDQFIYSPFFSNPVINAYLTWRQAGFRSIALNEIFSSAFVFDRLLPAQIAGWTVWIPGVSLVYFMPPLLQMPVAVLVGCFWSLILTSIQENARAQSPVG